MSKPEVGELVVVRIQQSVGEDSGKLLGYYAKFDGSHWNLTRSGRSFPYNGEQWDYLCPNRQQVVEAKPDDCNCDLCQCFGQGNCQKHEENCEHCNENKEGNCPWLEDI